MYQLVVCTLVCVHTGEAFINQPGRCASQSRLRDTEGGGGVDADREPSEGRRRGSMQKRLCRKGLVGLNAKRDCS